MYGSLFTFSVWGARNETTIIILIEWYIQSSRRNSILGIFVNPIRRKVAALIIFKRIQFSGRAHSSRHHEAFLVKQNGKVTGRARLFSVPGQEAFLSKQVVTGRQNDAQAVEVPEAYTLLAESLR